MMFLTNFKAQKLPKTCLKALRVPFVTRCNSRSSALRCFRANLITQGSADYSDSMRGNGRVVPGRPRLDIEKSFFSKRALRYWHRLPREGGSHHPQRYSAMEMWHRGTWLVGMGGWGGVGLGDLSGLFQR